MNLSAATNAIALETAPADSSSAEAPTVHGDGLINILIVDDEPKNLTVLETVLDFPRYRLIRRNPQNRRCLRFWPTNSPFLF